MIWPFRGPLEVAGDIWVVILASEGAIGISCVDTGDTCEYPTMHRKAPQQRIIWLQMPIVLRLKTLVGTFYQQMKKGGGGWRITCGSLWVLPGSGILCFGFAPSPLARTKSHDNTQQWMRLGSVEGWWPGRRGAGLLSICAGSDMRHICLQLWPIKVLFRSLSIYALLLLKSFRLINHGCNTDLAKLL